MNKSIAKYEAFKNNIDSEKAKTMSHLIYTSLLIEPKTIVYFRDVLKMPHQTFSRGLEVPSRMVWI